MELTEKDKLTICYVYDQILKRNENLYDLLNEEEVEELQKNPNYNGLNYQEQTEIMMEIVRIVKKTNPNLDTESIVKYISNPDFDVKLDIENSTINKDKRSLNDTILTRRTSSQVVLGKEITRKLPKENLFDKTIKVTDVPVIKLTKVDISEDMFYIYEEISYVPDMVLEKMKTKAKLARREASDVIKDKKQDTNHRVWSYLESKKYDKYQVLEPTIYRNIEDFENEFKNAHDTELENNWIEGQTYIIDNRPHLLELIDKENPAGTLQLQKQFKISK